jgi:molybdate transport system substrate-binding protein
MKPVIAAMLSLLSGSVPALAAAVQVLSAGAMQPALIAIAGPFKADTGHEVSVNYATAPELLRRVGGGEVADLVLAPPAVIAELAKHGKVAADGQVSLGRVGAGVVVRDGAPLPDISSAEALKRSLLAADSVAYNRASSGIYIESMLKRLGVFEQIETKLVRLPDGTAVMHRLMEGKGREFGFGGVTDILLYRNKGLTFIGPLPDEIQNYTSYTAALIAAAPNRNAAHALLRFLESAAGKELLAASGIR